MAGHTNTFTVKTNIIQPCVEQVSDTDALAYHIPLSYNFGVAHIKMPVSSIRSGPFHILFSLDNSGSMSSDLDNVKYTLYNILQYLNELDIDIYVTVQYFNAHVNSIVTNTLLTLDTLSYIKEKSLHVHSEGMTNIEESFAQVCDVYHDGSTNIHIFMTDGEPTVGESYASKLCEYLPSTFEHFYLGFNANHNSKLLYDLCLRTSGHYYFIDSPENSSLIYGEILHKFLYRATNLQLSSNGKVLFYDYKTNNWKSTYDYGYIVSDDNISVHYKFDWDTQHDDLTFSIRSTTIDEKQETYSVYSVCNETDTTYNLTATTDFNTRHMNVEKYYYRQHVLETLYDCLQEQVYSSELLSNMEILFDKIKKFCQYNELIDDPFMSQLKDDLSMVYTTSQYGNAFDTPYCLARHVSQGSQTAYNVHNINVGYGTGIDNRLMTAPMTPRRDGSIRLRRSVPQLLHQDQYSFMTGTDPIDNCFTPWEHNSPIGTPSIVSHMRSSDSTSAYATPHQTQVMDSIIDP